MRTTNIILLSTLIIIGSVTFFFACKYTYDSKVTILKEKAKKAFIVALDKELKNRHLEGDLSVSFNSKSLLRAELPDSVYLVDASGRHAYRLDPEKHRMNITENGNIRFMHSITFIKRPICPDSLNMAWGDQLQAVDIIAKPALCISVSDEKGNVKEQYSTGSEWCNSPNRVFTTYMGHACEIEIKGYLFYSLWTMIFAESFIYLLLITIAVYGIYRASLILCIHIRLVNRVKMDEQPIAQVFQEVEATPTRIYAIHESIIFYAEQKKIEVNGVEKKIQNQSSALLELFLKEKESGYILEDEAIMATLWPDGTGTSERIHKAIGRLRSCIRQIDDSIDIKRGIGIYQLLL